MSQQQMEILVQYVLVGKDPLKLKEADWYALLDFIAAWTIEMNKKLHRLPTSSERLAENGLSLTHIFNYASQGLNVDQSVAELMGLSNLARYLSLRGEQATASRSLQSSSCFAYTLDLVLMLRAQRNPLNLVRWALEVFQPTVRPDEEVARRDADEKDLTRWSHKAVEQCCRVATAAACGAYDLAPAKLQAYFDFSSSARRGRFDVSPQSAASSQLRPAAGSEKSSPIHAESPVSRNPDDDDAGEPSVHHETIAKEQEALRNQFLQSYRNEAKNDDDDDGSSDDDGEVDENGVKIKGAGKRRKASRQLRLAGIVFRPAALQPPQHPQPQQLSSVPAVLPPPRSMASSTKGLPHLTSNLDAPPQALRPPANRLPATFGVNQSAEFNTLFHSLDATAPSEGTFGNPPVGTNNEAITKGPAHEDAVCMDSDDDADVPCDPHKRSLFAAASTEALRPVASLRGPSLVVLGGGEGGGGIGGAAARRRIAAADANEVLAAAPAILRPEAVSMEPTTPSGSTPPQIPTMSSRALADLHSQAVSALDNHQFGTAARLFLAVLRGAAAAAATALNQRGGEDDQEMSLEEYCHKHIAAKIL